MKGILVHRNLAFCGANLVIECRILFVDLVRGTLFMEFANCVLGLLANLKETREVKRACQVEATRIRSVIKRVILANPKWTL